MTTVQGSRRSPPTPAVCTSGHHGQSPPVRPAEPEPSALGLRPDPPDGPLPARDHYENLIAQNYADQGYVKFAEVLEAGQVCAGCHLTRLTNGVPTDEQLDLERYATVASLARVLRVTTEIVATGYMSAVSAMEVRVASQSFRITARNLSDGLDEITLRRIGEEIARDPVASRAYRQMQDQGTEVVFEFGRPPPGLDGEALRFENRIIVYVQNHRSAMEAVRTMVHETSHIHRMYRGNIVNQLDEVRAFSREFVYERGRRPTLQEREAIWARVRRDYADLGE